MAAAVEGLLEPASTSAASASAETLELALPLLLRCCVAAAAAAAAEAATSKPVPTAAAAASLDRVRALLRRVVRRGFAEAPAGGGEVGEGRGRRPAAALQAVTVLHELALLDLAATPPSPVSFRRNSAGIRGEN